MKKFNVDKMTDTDIVLSDQKELNDLYETIKSEENFIVVNKESSEVIIATNILAKVKNGEIKLSATKQKVK